MDCSWMLYVAVWGDSNKKDGLPVNVIRYIKHPTPPEWSALDEPGISMPHLSR
jgi:hypothetical protein